MTKAQHYNPTKPTRIIMDFPTGADALPGYPEGPAFAVKPDGEPYVFANLSKARKHASHSIDSSLHKYLNYVNDTPQAGWGDREATHNKRCLKCNGFLRPGEESKQQLAPGVVMEVRDTICPRCDLGE